MGSFSSCSAHSGWLPGSVLGLIVLLLGLVLPGGAARAYDVDLEIVLAVDASGSVNDEEFKLQLRGIAEALRDPRIQDAIRSGPRQKVAMSMLVWSDAAFPKFKMPWHILSSPQSAIAFAAKVETFHEKAGRTRGIGGGGTAIGSAIDFAIRMMESNGIAARRQVVDVSGDGIETKPWFGEAVLLPEARRTAAQRGVMVNGLAILNDFPELDRYYQRNVIVGPGSFVIEAKDFDDFKRAIREKMWLEIITRVSETR